MMIILASVALASPGFCQDSPTPSRVPCLMITPVITCVDYTYTVYNETSNITNGSLTAIKDGIYKFTFNEQKGDYIVRLCDNSTREVYVEGDDNMASLAIAIFILAITASVFALGIFKRDYVRYTHAFWHEVVNMIIRRGLITIGFFMLAFNGAIFATIADSAGLGLEQEMFFFMRIFGYAGYICALITIASIPLTWSKLLNTFKQGKREGQFDD